MIENNNQLLILELFAGTRSISKAFEQRGHKTFTVERGTKSGLQKIKKKCLIDLIPSLLCNHIVDISEKYILGDSPNRIKKIKK